MNAVSRPNKFPILIALLSCLLAGVIYLVETLQLSPLIYLAYLLTPFIPIGMMAIIQTKDAASRSNIQYDMAAGQKYLKIARVLAIVGFIIAVPVIWVISGIFRRFRNEIKKTRRIYGNDNYVAHASNSSSNCKRYKQNDTLGCRCR